MLTNLLMLLVTAADPTPPAAKAEPAAIKLYALDCGHAQFADIGAFADTGDYDGIQRDFISPCFLVRHPTKGDFLFDSGLGDALNAKGPQAMMNGWVTASVPTTLASQLKQLNMTYDDIEFFAFSHGHFDHIGNANAFTKATWIVAPKEVAWVKETKGQHPELLTAYAKAKKIDLEGDYDVFGDGSVKLIRTPGHTPEHHSLIVHLPKSGYYIISGDLAHQHESYDKNLIPAFNSSRAETLASLDRVKRLATKLSAKFIVSHDTKDFATLAKFPAAQE